MAVLLPGCAYRPVSYRACFLRKSTGHILRTKLRAAEDSIRVDKVETQLPALASSSSAARAFLRAALQTWELDGFGEVTELLTTELVANVVRHVGAPMTVRALRQPTTIRVEVDDPSPEPPVAKNPELLDDHGRGLLMIAALADEWGVTQHPGDGKTVWFKIDVATATDEVHDG
jgi:anti-sigma regulatory factor (Ser/Thr protein kinase)